MRFRATRHLIALLLGMIVLKAGLAVITPSSGDFGSLALESCFTSYEVGFRGWSPAYTFSKYVLSIFYRLWLCLPVEHPPAYSVFRNFQPVPAFFLLIFIFKLPSWFSMC